MPGRAVAGLSAGRGDCVMTVAGPLIRLTLAVTVAVCSVTAAQEYTRPASPPSSAPSALRSTVFAVMTDCDALAGVVTVGTALGAAPPPNVTVWMFHPLTSFTLVT